MSNICGCHLGGSIANICHKSVLKNASYCEDHKDKANLEYEIYMKYTMGYNMDYNRTFPYTAREGYVFELDDGLLVVKTLKCEPDFSFEEVRSDELGDTPMKVYALYSSEYTYTCTEKCIDRYTRFIKITDTLPKCNHDRECECIKIHRNYRYRPILYVPEF